MTTAAAGRGGEAPRPSPGTGTRAEAGSSSGTSQTVRPRRPPPGSRAGRLNLKHVIIIWYKMLCAKFIAKFINKERLRLILFVARATKIFPLPFPKV